MNMNCETKEHRTVVCVIDSCADVNIIIASAWDTSYLYDWPEALGAREFHCCSDNVHWTGIDVEGYLYR